MAGEKQHDQGREGVRFARRWLDRTTRVAITWDVYDGEHFVVLPQLHGKPRAYDMRGNLINEDGTNGPPLLVEVKHYKESRSEQSSEYLDFLAKSYSATAKAIKDDADVGTEFMWVTWHPFALTHWSRLDQPEWIDRAVSDTKRKAEYIGRDSIDTSIIERLTKRIMILVMGRRAKELTMSDWLIAEVKRLMYDRGNHAR